MGRDVNHEFMAVAAVGGRVRLVQELRLRRPPGSGDARRTDQRRRRTRRATSRRWRRCTPALPGIAGVADELGVAPGELLKSIAFDVDGEIGLALVPATARSTRTCCKRPSRRAPAAPLFDDEDFERRRDLPKGYIGRTSPASPLVVADRFVRSGASWVTGANEPDFHVRRAVLDRDFHVDVWADIAEVVTGDPCLRCGEPLSVDRGIEVGQVFQLGTKYTEALECTYTDEGGEQHPMVMGCYGIGVTRTVAAVAEEHHDDLGFAWPASVAPYDVHLVALPGKGEQSADVVAAADRLYDELTAAGVEVLYDDRPAQAPGIKFADADLLGMPARLTVGPRAEAGRGRAPRPRHRRRRRDRHRRRRRPCLRAGHDAPGHAAGIADVPRSSCASSRPATGCCTSRSGTGSAASCSATATRSSSAAATSARSTGTSPSSSRTCAALPERAVLDGEIVIATEQGLDFDLLQMRIHPAASRVAKLAAETPSSFVAFDLLAEGDEDLRQHPLSERRQRLERMLRRASRPSTSPPRPPTRRSPPTGSSSSKAPVSTA